MQVALAQIRGSHSLIRQVALAKLADFLIWQVGLAEMGNVDTHNIFLTLAESYLNIGTSTNMP